VLYPQTADYLLSHALCSSLEVAVKQLAGRCPDNFPCDGTKVSSFWQSGVGPGARVCRRWGIRMELQYVISAAALVRPGSAARHSRRARVGSAANLNPHPCAGTAIVQQPNRERTDRLTCKKL